VGSDEGQADTAVDAFNQTEAGRLQGGKGTGLGLALVRQIVKLSGGRLGLRSKVSEGSTFWVELRERIT
jgi:osomolarity two-component system sensor histidine kinase SLN1